MTRKKTEPNTAIKHNQQIYNSIRSFLTANGIHMAHGTGRSCYFDEGFQQKTIKFNQIKSDNLITNNAFVPRIATHKWLTALLLLLLLYLFLLLGSITICNSNPQHNNIVQYKSIQFVLQHPSFCSSLSFLLIGGKYHPPHIPWWNHLYYDSI